MATRVFSNEDGNPNSKSIIVSRTKENKDIDLSFTSKFIGTELSILESWLVFDWVKISFLIELLLPIFPLEKFLFSNSCSE